MRRLAGLFMLVVAGCSGGTFVAVTVEGGAVLSLTALDVTIANNGMKGRATLGWEFQPVVATSAGQEEKKLLRLVGETYMAETGRQVVAVRRSRDRNRRRSDSARARATLVPIIFGAALFRRSAEFVEGALRTPGLGIEPAGPRDREHVAVSAAFRTVFRRATPTA